jgi:hypothetical protein
VVELTVLLPAWEMTSLEKAARGRGLTTARMIRHLLGDFLRRSGGARPEA